MGQPDDRGAATRFEATIHSTTRSADLGGVDALDLDRVPDPDGGVRMLIGPEDMARLVAQGYEVRVLAAVPVRPLDPGLVAGESDVRAWFDEQTMDARGER